jgi:hypothetical protein
MQVGDREAAQMATTAKTALEIELDDRRVIVGRPRPEDEDRMFALIGSYDTVNFSLEEDDVSGHATSNDVTIDLEGHAFTLRLPTSADAEALRKALMIGAMSATVVAAGAIAATQAPAAPASVVPIDKPAAPAQNLELATQREQRLSEFEAAPISAGTSSVETTGSNQSSGELEFDR